MCKSFRLGAGEDTTVFPHHESGFIPHQPPPPCCPRSDKIKVVSLRCTGGEVSDTSALAWEISPLGLSPKDTGDNIAKAIRDWRLEGSEADREADHSDRLRLK